MRKNIRFIALMLLCSIFSTTVSATNLGSGKINTDNGNSISAQDNVVGKKFAVDVLDINGEYAEATITGISSEYNVVVSRSNIETVSPINGKYSFILNETYAVSIDYEESGSKYYSYFEFEIDNLGNVAYGNSMNNEVDLESSFSTSNVTRGAGTIQESEPNDSFATADRTYDDYDNYGLVSSYNDKDFWVVSFDYSGTANFWLGNVPSGCNYDIAVYDSNQEFIEYSCNAGSAQELITIDVEANTNYYIYLVGYISYNTSSQYWLRVKNYPSNTISSVPLYIQQETNTCGSACGSMMLASYGINVTESTFKERATILAGEYADFTYVYVIRDTINYFLRTNNNSTRYKYTEVATYNEVQYENLVLTNILNNHPVQLTMKVTSTNYFPYTLEGHYVVIKGMRYNTNTASYDSIVNDPHHTHSGIYTVPLSTLLEYSQAHRYGGHLIHVDD